MSKLDKEAFDVFFKKVVAPALKKEEKAIEKIKKRNEQEQSK